MTETQLMLNAEEKDLLVKLLEREVSERLVEEHRTRTPAYREHILHDEAVLRGTLTKLSEEPATVEQVR